MPRFTAIRSAMFFFVVLRCSFLPSRLLPRFGPAREFSSDGWSGKLEDRSYLPNSDRRTERSPLAAR